MRKLKAKEIPKARKFLMKKQKNKCPLCERDIVDPVLDHDHVKGNVRSVLCRECNSIEGKIANWSKSFGKDVDLPTLLQNLVTYHAKDWSNRPFHPKHKTTEDKEIRKLRKKMAKAKMETTKKRLKEEIKALKKGV